MKQTITGMDCTYAIACKGNENSLSYCTQFDPCGNGEQLWNDLMKNAKLTEPVADETLKGIIIIMRNGICGVIFM